jgi:DNA-binding transcriptional LysR family regulator
MEVKDLELFADVARAASFAAVAKERNVDPSTVSRNIVALEDELGIRLFQRTTRRMTLTEAGDIYLARVESLLEELDHARDAATSASGKPRGTLRLTASVTFGQMRIVPLLREFRALYPDLKLECVFTDATVDLVGERIDLAIRLGPAVQGDVIAAKLIDTHYRVVASSGYIASAPPLTKPAQLTEHRCVLFNIRAFRTRWLFRDSKGSVTEIPIDGDITLSPANALRQAAIDGLGPALLPSWLVDPDIAAGRLVNAFPKYEITATTFETAAWLVYPSRAFLPNKVRVMIDFLRQRIA